MAFRGLSGFNCPIHVGLAGTPPHSSRLTDYSKPKHVWNFVFVGASVERPR